MSDALRMGGLFRPGADSRYRYWLAVCKADQATLDAGWLHRPVFMLAQSIGTSMKL